MYHNKKKLTNKIQIQLQIQKTNENANTNTNTNTNTDTKPDILNVGEGVQYKILTLWRDGWAPFNL